jgi:hypothetical protein
MIFIEEPNKALKTPEDAYNESILRLEQIIVKEYKNIAKQVKCAREITVKADHESVNATDQVDKAWTKARKEVKATIEEAARRKTLSLMETLESSNEAEQEEASKHDLSLINTILESACNTKSEAMQAWSSVTSSSELLKQAKKAMEILLKIKERLASLAKMDNTKDVQQIKLERDTLNNEINSFQYYISQAGASIPNANDARIGTDYEADVGVANTKVVTIAEEIKGMTKKLKEERIQASRKSRDADTPSMAEEKTVQQPTSWELNQLDRLIQQIVTQPVIPLDADEPNEMAVQEQPEILPAPVEQTNLPMEIDLPAPIEAQENIVIMHEPVQQLPAVLPAASVEIQSQMNLPMEVDLPVSIEPQENIVVMHEPVQQLPTVFPAAPVELQSQAYLPMEVDLPDQAEPQENASVTAVAIQQPLEVLPAASVEMQHEQDRQPSSASSSSTPPQIEFSKADLEKNLRSVKAANAIESLASKAKSAAISAKNSTTELMNHATELEADKEYMLAFIESIRDGKKARLFEQEAGSKTMHNWPEVENLLFKTHTVALRTGFDHYVNWEWYHTPYPAVFIKYLFGLFTAKEAWKDISLMDSNLTYFHPVHYAYGETLREHVTKYLPSFPGDVANIIAEYGDSSPSELPLPNYAFKSCSFAIQEADSAKVIVHKAQNALSQAEIELKAIEQTCEETLKNVVHAKKEHQSAIDNQRPAEEIERLGSNASNVVYYLNKVSSQIYKAKNIVSDTKAILEYVEGVAKKTEAQAVAAKEKEVRAFASAAIARERERAAAGMTSFSSSSSALFKSAPQKKVAPTEEEANIEKAKSVLLERQVIVNIISALTIKKEEKFKDIIKKALDAGSDIQEILNTVQKEIDNKKMTKKTLQATFDKYQATLDLSLTVTTSPGMK